VLVVAGLPSGADVQVVVDAVERSAVATAEGRCEVRVPGVAPAGVRVSVH
jgi:hypothetical protein